MPKQRTSCPPELQLKIDEANLVPRSLTTRQLRKLTRLLHEISKPLQREELERWDYLRTFGPSDVERPDISDLIEEYMTLIDKYVREDFRVFAKYLGYWGDTTIGSETAYPTDSVRLKAPCLVNGKLRKAGDMVEVEDIPEYIVEPLDPDIKLSSVWTWRVGHLAHRLWSNARDLWDLAVAAKYVNSEIGEPVQLRERRIVWVKPDFTVEERNPGGATIILRDRLPIERLKICSICDKIYWQANSRAATCGNKTCQNKRKNDNRPS